MIEEPTSKGDVHSQSRFNPDFDLFRLKVVAGELELKHSRDSFIGRALLGRDECWRMSRTRLGFHLAESYSSQVRCYSLVPPFGFISNII